MLSKRKNEKPNYKSNNWTDFFRVDKVFANLGDGMTAVWTDKSCHKKLRGRNPELKVQQGFLFTLLDRSSFRL